MRGSAVQDRELRLGKVSKMEGAFRRERSGRERLEVVAEVSPFCIHGRAEELQVMLDMWDPPAAKCTKALHFICDIKIHEVQDFAYSG